MKNNIENNQQENNEDIDFEITLFNSLRSYGYIFPKNVKDVERFEELYGNTEIQTPEIILPNKDLNQDNGSINFGFKMAAFNPKETNSFNFLNNTRKNEEDTDNSIDK